MPGHLEFFGLQLCNEEQDRDPFICLEDATLWFINVHQVLVGIRLAPQALSKWPGVVGVGISEGLGVNMISTFGKFTVVCWHSIY